MPPTGATFAFAWPCAGTRNCVGTHFGGSLYAMTEAFFMIMVMKNLGPDYEVWDKAAEIEFVSPGRGTVTAEFRLSHADLEGMRAGTEGGAKHFCWLETHVLTRVSTPPASTSR